MKRFLSNIIQSIVCCMMLAITTSTVSAENNLAWKTFRLPGYYNGAVEDKGIADKILDYYIKNLPEYKHNTKEMPIVRLFKEMSVTTEGAYLGPGKTKLPPDQLKKVLASTIHLVMPPPGLAIRKRDISTHFSGGKNLSLRHLLNNEKKVVFCWIRGATYHPKIREAVEDYVKKNPKHPKHPNVRLLSRIEENRFKMIDSGRIDYFPDHAIPFQYECAKQKVCLDNMVFASVNEARDDVYTYTFAARTKTGGEVIEKINKIHNSEEYKKFLRELIPLHYPPNLVDIYIEKNMELVGKEMG